MTVFIWNNYQDMLIRSWWWTRTRYKTTSVSLCLQNSFLSLFFPVLDDSDDEDLGKYSPLSERGDAENLDSISSFLSKMAPQGSSTSSLPPQTPSTPPRPLSQQRSSLPRPVEVFFAPPPPPLLFQELAESMLHPFRIIADPLLLGYFI